MSRFRDAPAGENVEATKNADFLGIALRCAHVLQEFAQIRELDLRREHTSQLHLHCSASRVRELKSLAFNQEDQVKLHINSGTYQYLGFFAFVGDVRVQFADVVRTRASRNEPGFWCSGSAQGVEIKQNCQTISEPLEPVPCMLAVSIVRIVRLLHRVSVPPQSAPDSFLPIWSRPCLLCDAQGCPGCGSLLRLEISERTKIIAWRLLCVGPNKAPDLCRATGHGRAWRRDQVSFFGLNDSVYAYITNYLIYFISILWQSETSNLFEIFLHDLWVNGSEPTPGVEDIQRNIKVGRIIPVQMHKLKGRTYAYSMELETGSLTRRPTDCIAYDYRFDH
jgi:hypothetical protein